MGTTAQVVVVAPEVPARAAAAWARRRLERLEAHWSRFVPTSDVSRCNAADGAPVVVAPETVALVERAVEGWRRTGGRFDPTVLAALCAHGYDRDFAALSPDAGTGARGGPAPGCGGIVVDRTAGSVRLPPGVGFDPGGIGKGLAADLVVRDLLERGAEGACVSVGGDLRVAGRAPHGAGWVVDLEHPLTGRTMAQVRLREGAVASTWRTRRVWGPPPARRHHIVDPSTGDPASSGLAGVSVLAGRAWWAEVLAKAAFLDGLPAGAALLREHSASGFLVDDDGTIHPAGAMHRFVIERARQP